MIKFRLENASSIQLSALIRQAQGSIFILQNGISVEKNVINPPKPASPWASTTTGLICPTWTLQSRLQEFNSTDPSFSSRSLFQVVSSMRSQWQTSLFCSTPSSPRATMAVSVRPPLSRRASNPSLATAQWLSMRHSPTSTRLSPTKKSKTRRSLRAS